MKENVMKLKEQPDAPKDTYVKYNFWQQVYQNPDAAYASLNMEERLVPQEIADRLIQISGDSDQIIQELIS